MEAKSPERRGEISQEEMMPERPLERFQLRQEGLVAARVMPTTADTIAWVVETGMAVKVASMRKIAAERRASIIPGGSLVGRVGDDIYDNMRSRIIIITLN